MKLRAIGVYVQTLKKALFLSGMVLLPIQGQTLTIFLWGWGRQERLLVQRGVVMLLMVWQVCYHQGRYQNFCLVLQQPLKTFVRIL